MRKLIGWLALMLVLTALLIGPTLLSGCSGSANQSVINPETTKVSYDMSTVITEGNRSYIPINSSAKPSDNPSGILLILESFEEAHPELDIIGWAIEKRQSAHLRTPIIFGIWVEHKPKER